MLFSVGVTDGVVVVVSVVLDGLGDSLPPQAVSAPMEMKAATPMPAATRRVIRLGMKRSYPCGREIDESVVGAGNGGRCGRRLHGRGEEVATGGVDALLGWRDRRRGGRGLRGAGRAG